MAKKYVLVEFPYPSGAGLHVGHAFSFTGADVYARYLRMKGNDVMFPMGWDAFGLPTENFAIRTGMKPQEATAQNTASFRKQMDELGLSFDWQREVNTTDPTYYKWTQWIFIKLFEKGLAEKQEMPINWCPKDKIGLANEEVVDGKCERCGTPVTKRSISQWVVKITAYADRLIEGLSQTDFIEKVKAAQINWIGKKVGARVKFELESDGMLKDEPLEIFTTRLDTIYGATFVVVAPEIAKRWLDVGWQPSGEVAKYIKESIDKAEQQRLATEKEKTGYNTGLYAVNPVSGEKIAVYVADYVLPSVGTGAIMGVPAHDERDNEFAARHELPVRSVVVEKMREVSRGGELLEEDGYLIESGPYSDLTSADARKEILSDLSKKGLAQEEITYHLRDWIFSRQHYWGEPIPMIYCEKDGWVTVPLSELPVRLPEVEKYQPTDTGESPLANIKEFVETKCPKCGGKARRETDTMPNWAGSDWYFLRYIDPKNDSVIADMEKMKYWLPVDVYVGGDEHNTLHLLYSRFIYQFLWDLGVVPKEFPEPYIKRLSHGVILGPDGNRMSKSRGNVITPGEIVTKHGADVLRAYLMFIGPFDATMAWDERTLLGVKRFLAKFKAVVEKNISGDRSERSAKAIHKLVRDAGNDYQGFKFNTAIAKMMEAVNELGGEDVSIGKEDLVRLVKVIAPVAPFLATELWGRLQLAGDVHTEPWPDFEPKLIESGEATIVVQVNGKTRGTIMIESGKAMDKTFVSETVTNDERYNKWIQGKKYEVIFVPGRLLNFVVE